VHTSTTDLLALNNLKERTNHFKGYILTVMTHSIYYFCFFSFVNILFNDNFFSKLIFLFMVVIHGKRLGTMLFFFPFVSIFES
jgi:hypothetical protein